MATVLIVDDERSIRSTLAEFLRGAGYTVETAEDATQAERWLQRQRFDVVVTDIVLPRVSGVELLKRIRVQAPDSLVLMMTGEPTTESAVAAVRAGAYDYLVKPVSKEVILRVVGRAVEIRTLQEEQRRLEAANREYQIGLERMVEERTRSLRESQANLARAEAFSQLMVTQIGLDGRWLKVPPLLGQLLGYTPAELLACRIQDVTPPEDALAHWRQYQVLLESHQKAFSAEKRFCRRDGEVLWFTVNTSLIVDAEGQPQAFLTYLLDVTETKRAQATIRAQAELLDLTPAAISLRDPTGRILYWNKGAERLLGWTTAEALGSDAPALVDAGAAPAILTCLEQTLRQGAWSGEREVRTKDNKKLQMHSAWRLLGDAPNVPRSCLVVDTDLTEKKQLEAQLLRAQRLESIGRLAGGLAHDINNILGSLLLSVPFLREEVQSKEGREVLEVMETGIQRGGNILKQVLTFARGTPQRRELVSSRVLLREIEKIVRGTFPQSILVRCLRSRGLWSLLADATQLHQMLLNLCVNARDAMSGGGRLLLSAKNVQLEQDFVRLVPEAKVGPYVEMVVADTGIGIPAENLDLIFDPFFTTKAPDAGTGLGLSTVLGIVKGHGGFVRVTSQPGRGTQFNVYLPAAEVAAKASPSRRAPAVAEGQGRLILLADDEKGLASVSRRVLEAQGYRVLTANDGSKAIALFDQHQREIDLVITDLQMPVLDGVAVVKHIRSLDPRARIIVSTGDLAGLPVSRSAELASVTTLWKPFTAEVLLRTVDTALKAPRRCASPSQAGGEPRPGLEGARQTRKPGARTVRDRRVPVQGEGNAAMAERPKP